MLAQPAAGRVALRGGPAPELAPFPVPGCSLLLPLLRVACHCWGLTCGCLCASPAEHTRDVSELRGRPLVDARAGFRQCGLFVEVFVVEREMMLFIGT